MRDCFAGLHLGNAVIHGAVTMARKPLQSGEADFLSPVTNALFMRLKWGRNQDFCKESHA
jgi:hypothetical protein